MEDSRINPFPGLRPFDFGEQHLFFGREGQSEQVLRHLRENRFLAVVGTSGSGKSSLIRAGLLPDLYGGFMASAGSHWRFAIFRPMNDPIGNLGRALNRPDVLQTEPPAGGDQTRSDMLLEVTLRRSGLGLVEATRLARIPANENLLVVVDQFEELFRFAAAANSGSQSDDAAAFVKLLLEASRQSGMPIYIVITMRSDFIGDCAKFPDLPEAVTAGMYLIPRMTREQRRRAIEEPVAVGGGAVSLRLVNRLLNEVGDNPDQLPILQHAVMRTWEHWVKRTPNTESFADDPIDFVDYEAIGGISGALSNHADEAYDALPDARRREIAKRMFQCLTEKGSDNREVRRPTSVGRIAAVAHASVEEVVDVIEEFHKQGRSFLTTPAGVALTGDAVIDISHESLIRLWVRLKEWVNQESESARTYCRLADDAERHARGQVSLLRDPELQNALNWKRDERPTAEWAERYHANFAEAMSFLDRSCEARAAAEVEKERQRTEELRRVKKHLGVVRSLGAVVGLSAVASIFFLNLWLREGKQRLRTNQAMLAASRAAQAAAEKERTLAVAVAMAERGKADEAEAKARAEVKAAMAQREAAAAKAGEQAAKQQAAVEHAENTELKTKVNQQNERMIAQQQQSVEKSRGTHQETNDTIGQYVDKELQNFEDMPPEKRNQREVQAMWEKAALQGIELNTQKFKDNPDDRDAVTSLIVSRDALVRSRRVLKPREQVIKTIQENQAASETIVADARTYYARTLGTALLAVSAESFRLMSDKDKALQAARRATQLADSIGLSADPKGADARYLTFLSIAYNNIGFVEKAYKENGRAIEAFQKAADARAKSLHISPSANSATDLVEDYEALASLQKDLRDFDGANGCYEHAITELNSYLSGKALTPAFSAILVRLHAARGGVFLEKKDHSGAEKEYQKAATEADGIDRKLQEARSYAVEADRTVGNAWRDLAEAVEDPTAKRKFIDLALRFHRRSLEQDLALLVDDKSAGRHRDLTYAYFNIGYDKLHLKEYEETRKAYNARVEAAAQAAKLGPSDEALRYLANCYQTVTQFEEDENVWDIPNAIKANSSRLEVLKTLVDRKDPDPSDKTNLSRTYGSRSWLEVLLGDFSGAFTDAETALKWDPDQPWILANRGHALLFLHRTAEAKQSYMQFIEGSSRDYDNLKSVMDDFKVFRKHHIPKADLKAAGAMESLLATPSGKDLPPAYAGALAAIYANRGDDALEKRKSPTEAEAQFSKAATAADGIDRKSAEGQAAAIFPDRIVGIAWRSLAQAVEDSAAKKKFIDAALRFHQRSLDQDLTLHPNNRNAEQHKNLTYGYNNLGLDYFLLHDFEDARRLYNAAAEAGAQAAKLAPSDDAIRYSAGCYQTVVNFESSDEVQNFANAIIVNQHRIDTLKPLVERDSPAAQDISNLAEAYGTNSWFGILLGNFSAALKDSEAALKLDPKQLWIIGNQGHALLFLHRIDEARQVYLEYAKGGKEDADNQKSVFKDFAEFRKRRPPNADLKLVDEMEDFLLTKGGYNKPSEKASN